MPAFISCEHSPKDNPYYSLKEENLKKAYEAYERKVNTVNHYPSRLTIQTTDACNLRCVMCQIPRPLKSQSHMDLALFCKLAAEVFPTLVECHPTNIGEPMVSPWFKTFCAALQEYGVLLDLTTNGTLLSEDACRMILPILKDVKISFDGAKPETFESIRAGAKFDAVRKNIERLVRLREELKPATCPTITLQVTLMRGNLCETPDILRMAADMGVDRVKAFPMFSFNPMTDPESLFNCQGTYMEIYKECKDLAAKLGIEARLAELPADDITDKMFTPKSCHLPWLEAWIDRDGSVYPCHSHGGVSCGSISNEKFCKIWTGKRYSSLRRSFAFDELEGNCKGCGMAFNYNNDDKRVYYDRSNFLSPVNKEGIPAPVRWSARTKQFDIPGLRP